MEKRTILWAFSLLNSLLIIYTSLQGLSSPSVYANETENWMTQSMGQDLINLSIVPFYIFTSSYRHKPASNFPFFWAGTTIYFIYTYLIYCFDIHFNSLFVLYCLILCLNFYLLLDFVYSSRHIPSVTGIHPIIRRITGSYFIFISLLFGFLWLSDIIPAALEGNLPASLEKVELFTNPVEVLDLSFVLPGILISGLLLLREELLGYFLAPVILTFMLLMEFTIGMLIIILWQKGLEEYPQVAWILFGLTAVNLVLLILNVNRKRLAL